MDIEKRDESVLTYNVWIIVVGLDRSSERSQLKVQLTGKTDLMGMWCCKAAIEPMCTMESTPQCSCQEKVRSCPHWEMNCGNTGESSA